MIEFLLTLIFSIVSSQEVEIDGKTIILKAPSIDESNSQVLFVEDPEISRLKKEIEDRSEEIKKSEKEIEELNTQLSETTETKQTLQNELNSITLTNKRNQAQINLANSNFSRSQSKLQQLNVSIGDNSNNIETLVETLNQNFRESNEYELRGSELSLFDSISFFDFVTRVEESETLSKSLSSRIGLVSKHTTELYRDRDSVITEKSRLTTLGKELEDRKRIYDISISKKAALVEETENSEEEYQNLLKSKLEEYIELRQELFTYESELEFIRDPNSLPKPIPGILKLPFDANIRVTQNFGETSFARANSNRYGRPFHDGIDFGIPSNTKLVSVAAGEVIGVGNTDLVRSCQSWGKWILIKHNIGLTTLYAHLSLTKVRLGQKVESGELIGYSGNTGFSTGPHLHFGVYDSNGVEAIPYERVSSSPRCRGLIVPVAAQEAKLDPRIYLPKF